MSRYVDGFVLPAQREQANKKVMADPRIVKIMESKTPPFDGRRMIYGGFKSLVEL